MTYAKTLFEVINLTRMSRNPLTLFNFIGFTNVKIINITVDNHDSYKVYGKGLKIL